MYYLAAHAMMALIASRARPAQAAQPRLIRCEIEDVPRIFRRFTATNTIRCAGSAAKNRT